MTRVKERFLRYVAVDTQSAEAQQVPSTKKQFDMARMLHDELIAMGCSNVKIGRAHV